MSHTSTWQTFRIIRTGKISKDITGPVSLWKEFVAWKWAIYRCFGCNENLLETFPCNRSVEQLKSNGEKGTLIRNFLGISREIHIWGSEVCEDVEVGLLGCNTMWTYTPKFRRKILPPSSGLNNDGGSTFLPYVDIYLQVDTTLQLRKSTWIKDSRLEIAANSILVWLILNLMNIWLPYWQERWRRLRRSFACS